MKKVICRKTDHYINNVPEGAPFTMILKDEQAIARVQMVDERGIPKLEFYTFAIGEGQEVEGFEIARAFMYVSAEGPEIQTPHQPIYLATVTDPQTGHIYNIFELV